MRAEIRVVNMTKTEYDAAMKQFLGRDYKQDKDNYRDYLMYEFEDLYMAGMEIALETTLQTQYYAALISNSGRSIDERLYELPESFNPKNFTGWEKIYE